MQRPIAITQGDVCGIGPEIILKACKARPAVLQACFCAGDVGTFVRAAARLGSGSPAVVEISAPEQALAVPAGSLGVLQVGPAMPVLPMGEIRAEAGAAAARCVRWAAQAALKSDIAALVTAPLHKEALAAAGEPYPGHTELLQAQAAAHLGRPLSELPVRMMLVNDELRTVLVSIHLSLRRALDAVTYDQVLETLRVTALHGQRTGSGRWRIAVAGLNPHAGEGGLFGSEEIDVIAPAISAARKEGIDVHGPFAPDTVFMRARARADGAREFDVVVAMYHDQGLIPVKYLGVAHGVNVTLGLPLVRTSPDHGTAFDIAGTGLAQPDSLLAAIALARDLC